MTATWRAILLVAIVLGGSAVPALGHPFRPSISSFYAKDEGAYIRLKVNFCGASTDRKTDSYSAVFRMWDENGSDSVKVLERRVSGRIRARCGYAQLAVPDDFPPGLYSANVAVVNRTRGGLIRIGVRYFWIY
jgi:hypothetical protein